MQGLQLSLRPIPPIDPRDGGVPSGLEGEPSGNLAQEGPSGGC